MTDKRRFDALVRQGPLALLLGAVAVFFWKTLTFAGVLFHWDLSAFNIPIRDFFFKNVAHGRFPLWSPQICGGFPLFDEGQMGPLYPFNYVLFTWLPAWYALNVSALLHAFGGAVGAYLYLKRSHSAAAAAIGAMLCILGAPLVYHLIHFMFFETFCLFPWLFFFFDRFLEKGRISDVLSAALALGAMFMTGHQQAPFLAAIAFGAFALVLAAETWAAGRPRIAAEVALAAAAIGALAAVMVAAVVLGMTHILEQSVRHEAMGDSFLYAYSLVPDALSRLASPAQHGHWRDLTWHVPGVEKELTVYLGLAVWCFLPLALVGGAARRDRAHLAVAAFGLLFILGKAGPFTGLIEHVPLLNRMRDPTRFILPMSLSFAFLAASGFDRLRRVEFGRRQAILLLLAGALAWCLAAWGGAVAAFGRAAFAGPTPGGGLPEALESTRAALHADLILRSGLAAVLVAASLLLVWSRGQKPLAQSALALVIGVVVFADLSTSGRAENPVASPAIYRPRATLDFLQPRLDGFRIYNLEGLGGGAQGGWAVFNPDAFLLDTIAGLPYAAPALYGIRSFSCDSPLVLSRHSRVLGTPAVNWLRQTSVKYVLRRGDQALSLPKAADAGDVRIFAVPDPAPIYSFARRVTLAAGGDAAFAAVTALGDDVTTAVVESGDESLLATPGNGAVQVLHEEPDFRRLRVRADGPAFLVVRENYYPGWRAAVDGRPTPLYRTNYLFSGLATPAGEHEVTLTFRPSGFRPAMAVSLGVFFGTFLLALFYRPLRRPRPALFDAPSPERIARLTLYAILAVFVVLLAVAILRHPALWDFSHVRSPRWL